MNSRKQHVINMAHQLFMEKGVQATSIQDILECSNISKGTFYNYFSSKNELIISLLASLHQQIERERDKLLVGQDPSDLNLFVKQIELEIKLNEAYQLTALVEEVRFIDDEELKNLLQRGQLKLIQWLYGRFIDLFGPDKEPYLLDCSIMFLGMIQQNLRYFTMTNQFPITIQQVVRYSVERLTKMISELATSGRQLFPPELLNEWLPEKQHQNQSIQQEIVQIITSLKNGLPEEKKAKYEELLHFIQEELLYVKKPRKFLIESSLHSIQLEAGLFDPELIEQLVQLINSRFPQQKKAQSSK